MYFDVHCHLTHERFSDDLSVVIERAKGVLIHCAGSGLSDCRAVLGLSRDYSNVKPSLGLYPWDAVALTEPEVDLVIDFIRKHHRELVCIGEVGLDHYWGKAEEDWETQEWVFNKFLELGVDLGKPVLVHTRKAEREVLGLLRGYDGRVIIHSFTGPQKLVESFVEQDCFFSIPSVVARDNGFKSLVKRVPIERLLTETDAPFLPAVAGQRSEPRDVKGIVKVIADLKGLTVKGVVKQLSDNYGVLFG